MELLVSNLSAEIKKNVLETFCAGGVAKRALLAASQRLQKPTEEGEKRQISHLLTSAFINSLLTGKTGKKYFGFCTPAKSLMGCGITSPQSFNTIVSFRSVKSSLREK